MPAPPRYADLFSMAGDGLSPTTGDSSLAPQAQPLTPSCRSRPGASAGSPRPFPVPTGSLGRVELAAPPLLQDQALVETSENTNRQNQGRAAASRVLGRRCVYLQAQTHAHTPTSTHPCAHPHSHTHAHVPMYTLAHTPLSPAVQYDPPGVPGSDPHAAHSERFPRSRFAGLRFTHFSEEATEVEVREIEQFRDSGVAPPLLSFPSCWVRGRGGAPQAEPDWVTLEARRVSLLFLFGAPKPLTMPKVPMGLDSPEFPMQTPPRAKATPKSHLDGGGMKSEPSREGVPPPPTPRTEAGREASTFTSVPARLS